MKSVFLKAACVAATAALMGAGSAMAQTPAPAAAGTWPAPEYVAIPMEITVNKPAAEVWAKIGGYCDISKWISPAGNVPCEVTSGKGEVGSVRKIANRVIEVMTAKSEFGYGYTQPAVEGKWYNLYHGFLEARPIDAKSSKLIYTLMLDVADGKDQAAKDTNVGNRRKQFEAALANMKKLAEGG